MSNGTHHVRSGKGTRSVVPGKSSFDATSRTLTYTLTTDKPCPAIRYRETDDGEIEAFMIQEILVPSGCINLDSIAGRPVVDSHDYSSIRNIIGTHLSASVVGNGVDCQIKLSGRDDVRALYDDFAEGIINAVSVGYVPLKETEPVADPAGGYPIVTVTEWRCDEGSFVVIPADSDAGARMSDGTPRTSIRQVRSHPVAAATEKTDFTAMMDALKAIRSAQETQAADIAALKGTRAEKKEAEAEKGEGEGTAAKKDMDEDARKARTADLAKLRPMAARYARQDDFDALAETGATVAEMRAACAGFASTTRSTVRSVAAGGAPGARADEGPALIDLKDTWLGKRMARR